MCVCVCVCGEGGGVPGALDPATYYMVSEDFFHNTYSYIDLRCVAIFDPRGLIGRIYVGDY